MNPELWKRVEAVYHQAMEQSAERRASFVEAACAGDRDLRAEVMELLAHADGGSAELRQPVSAATDAILGHPATSLEGQTIGQYQIERWLGAGGAGHVYRARDLTLGRAVALKFLAQAFTRDPSRIARLRSEAQLLARLNHPHIAAIYDLEESGPAPFLVLELVDGETLDARIRRSRLSVQEAIAFALQLASALEAAHERGVIHGDLKPANVALTHDECLKVLDFGLAVVTRTEPSESNDVGAITGTPAYMAPEVVKGRQADKRSDVWGFGCALFEMLTGQRAFRGKDVPETLAAVMFEEPDWSALPSRTPTHIRRLLVRCLNKDRGQRLCDLGDARLELATPADVEDIPASVRKGWRWARFAKRAAESLVIMAAAVGVLVLIMAERPSHEAAPEQRFTIDLPESADAFEVPALSPDGTRLVYAIGRGRSSRLYLRSLDRIDPQPMAGTEGASNPFFSHDGRWVGFFFYGSSGWSLKKVPINGGPAITLCETSAAAGAAWDDNDTIVFAGRRAGVGGTWVGSTLYRVSANGGIPTALTRLDSNGLESHDWPQILPSGDTVLYSVTDRADYGHGRVLALSLKTGKSHTVIERGYHAQYLRTGHLLYGSGRNLMVVPFDVNRQSTVGTPVPVVEGILGNAIRGSAAFAVSPTGMLVYALADPAPRRVLTWVDRNGLQKPFDMPPGDYSTARLSPDGSRIALTADATTESSSIWTWDIARRQLNRVTFGVEVATSPVWTPDGHHLLFWSNHGGGTFNVYRHAADGTGETERVTTSPNPQLPLDVLSDGSRLIVQEASEQTGTFLRLVSVADGRGTSLLASTMNYYSGRISPDRRWIAYRSNELGSYHIHVRPFPDLNRGHWLVSDTEADTPVWSRDGRELFFVTSKQPKALMVVSIPPGATFRSGHPRKLMDWRYRGTYDVSIDGRYFLVTTDVDAADNKLRPASQLVVVLNWLDQLKHLAPVGDVLTR